MILGITGIFGSGKTTVARMFAKHGFAHINADEVGHRLIERKAIKKKVISLFGKKVLSKGKIDRKKLKAIVFSDYRSLKQLNGILHPAILGEIAGEIAKNIKKNSRKNIIIDAPLLIEAMEPRGAKLVDKVIVVTISKKEQMRRLLAKGKWSKKEILQISKSQLSQVEKVKRADFVVGNSGEKRETSRIVNVLINKIKRI